MRRPLLVAVLVCVALPSHPRAAVSWSRASSAHFEVFTTGGARTARDALTYFERVHAFFTDFLRVSPQTGQPTRLIVFSNDREFAPYRPNEVAAAYYQPGPDRDYIVMKSLGPESYPIVVHEYVHLVLRHTEARFPVWLNEGLAEFFSTLEPEGRRMGVGRVPLGRLQHLANVTRLIPLTRLLAIGHDAPEYNNDAHAGTFYSESWALVHMILTDARYRPQAQAFLNRVTAGTDAGAALSELYGKPVAALQQELEGYIRRQAYTYFVADYRDPPSLEKVPVEVVDEFEAGLVTATLLANVRAKEMEARTALDELARKHPDHLGLVEARALFERQRGHAAEALPYYARAVALGSTNVRLYREYAALVESTDPARAETLFATAVANAPNDLETRLRLANHQLRQRKAAGALETLKPVTRVSAEHAFMLFQIMANAYRQTEQLTEAREAAGLALKHAQTAQERDYASGLVTSLNEYAARRAEAEARRSAAAAEAATPAKGPIETRMIPVGGRAPRSTAGAILVQQGRITNVVCGTGSPIVEVTTSKDVIRLVIDDQYGIRVAGRNAAATDLLCGTQNVAIVVGYEAAADPAQKTAGRLRLLDYAVK